jgi:hypothetical protein
MHAGGIRAEVAYHSIIAPLQAMKVPDCSSKFSAERIDAAAFSAFTVGWPVE